MKFGENDKFHSYINFELCVKVFHQNESAELWNSCLHQLVYRCCYSTVVLSLNPFVLSSFHFANRIRVIYEDILELVYRVSFNSLRTLWALLNIKNEGKCSSKSYRFKEEGCDFHSQLLFFSYVEANVFYSPWHLKLLKHEISSWSYICPSVKKINIHPTVSLFWLYAFLV